MNPAPPPATQRLRNSHCRLHASSILLVRIRADRASIESAFDLQVQWKELSQLRYVGKGAMCRIYSANLDGRKVAVKIARDDIQNGNVAEHDLEVELAVLTNLRHKNIIQLLGAGMREVDGTQYRFLVLEFLELGTLADGIAAGVCQGHQRSALTKLVQGAKR